MKKLNEFELPFKLLITGFLIVLSCGFATAHLYLQFMTEMADGKPGLGLDDITYTYHGNPKNTTFKKFVNGSMKKYFSEVEDDKQLTPEEIADIEAVLAWNDAGAKEEGYWDPQLKEKDKNKKSVYRILDTRGCYNCHDAEATMKGNKKDAPLDTFADISRLTKPDTGMPVSRLLSLMHIHLLGMGMMITLVSTAVAFTAWHKWLRCAVILAGLSSVLFDVLGWAAVKFGGPMFSPLVMLGGGLRALSFGASVAMSMYDMWIRKTKPEASK